MVKNQIKLGAVLHYVQLIAGIILTVCITPTILKYLGQSEYGIYNLAGSTVVYLNLITMGVGGAFVKFNVQYRSKCDVEGENKLNGTFMWLYLIMSAIMLICGIILVLCSKFIFAANLTPDEVTKTQIVMAISIADMVITLPFSVYTMYINAYEHYVFANSINIINTVLNPLIRLPIVLLGGKAIAISIGMTALHMVSNVASMIYARKKLNMKFIFGKVDTQLVKTIFAFSAFILLNQVIDMINWNIDKFVLGIVCGTGVVAVYSLGATFNTYTLQFSTAISGVLRTRVHLLVAEDPTLKKVEDLFINAGRLQFLIVAFIILSFSFFGKAFVVNFYADETYEQAYLIGVLLIVPLIIPLIQNVGIEILYAVNKHKFRAYLYMGIAVVNAIATVPLSIYFGGIGGAMATCVSLVIGNGLLMNIYYHKKVGLNMIRFWKSILSMVPGLIIPIAVGTCIMLFVDLSNLWVFLGYAVLFTIIYAISVYLLSINKKEREFINNKIFHRHKTIATEQATTDTIEQLTDEVSEETNSNGEILEDEAGTESNKED